MRLQIIVRDTESHAHKFKEAENNSRRKKHGERESSESWRESLQVLLNLVSLVEIYYFHKYSKNNKE